SLHGRARKCAARKSAGSGCGRAGGSWGGGVMRRRSGTKRVTCDTRGGSDDVGAGIVRCAPAIPDRTVEHLRRVGVVRVAPEGEVLYRRLATRGVRNQVMELYKRSLAAPPAVRNDEG